MALQPVNRRSVPEDVFEQILADVLSGEMRPGEPLPSERRLAEALRQSMLALLSGPGSVDAKTGKAAFSYAHPLFWAPFVVVGD